eukprot:TRINITY_DN2455_c0_g1_i2.p1 TRINITY_DN2455_c0_g1~~TRINITY_DN2455_c0_g1_i2.p1  ORF type:complete len:2136 (+),score=850.97 TRINITY_DN2455_c0_g1_i2:915-6410(+)
MVDAGHGDDALKELAYALFSDEDLLPAADAAVAAAKAAPKPRNRTPEDIALELRQRLAGVLVAQGRVWAVADAGAAERDHPADAAYLFELSPAAAPGEYTPLEGAADLKAAVRWLETGCEEAPELVAPRCLLAVLHYRLGDAERASIHAVRGLAAVAARQADRSLPEDAVSMWALRLASVACSALHRISRSAAARAVGERAAALAEGAGAVLLAGVLQKDGEAEAAAQALKLAASTDAAGLICRPDMDALPPRKLTSTSTFRAELDRARVAARVLRDRGDYDRGLAAVDQALKRACATVGVEWRGAALDAAAIDAMAADGDAFAAALACRSSCGIVLCRALSDLLSLRAQLLWDGADGDQAQCLASARLAAALDARNPEAHCVIGSHYLSLQRRPDVDGNHYTKAEFKAVYPTVQNWVAARYTEKRVDKADGKQYTKKQFEAEYGAMCAEWDAAPRVKPAPTEDDEAAIAAFFECLALDPLHALAGRRLCALLNGLQDAERLLKAAKIIVAAAEVEKGGAVARFTWAFKIVAFQSLKDGKFDAASHCFRECLRFIPATHPAHIEVLYGLARAYEGQGQVERALQQYRAIGKAGKRAGAAAAAPGRTTAAMHGEAACLVAMGEVWAAKELLLELTAGAPDAEPSWSLLAQCHVKLATMRARAYGEDSEYEKYRGIDAAEQVDKALAAANESLRCARRHPNALRLKGDVALAGALVLPRHKRHAVLEVAAAAFHEVLDAVQGPQDFAKEQRAMAMYDVARAAYALFTLAKQEQAAGAGAAAATLASSRRIPTAEDAEAHRAKAEAHCRRAIELLPRCAAFWTLLGCAVPAEYPNRRLHCLAKAVQLEPRSAPAWCVQGWLWLLYSQPDTARMCFERAKAVDEAAYQPWLGLGLCMQRKAFGVTTYDSRNCFEQAFQDSHLKETALLSLVAQHFHQPRRYGTLGAHLAPRALSVKEGFPHDPAALNTAGLVLEELGSFEHAYDAFHAAEQALSQEAKPDVLQWTQGRHAVVAMRAGEAAQWSLVDAFNAHRMVLTSKLRVLCKLKKGADAAAGRVAADLEALFKDDGTGAVNYHSVAQYETTARALLCHYLNGRKYEAAAALFGQFLRAPETEGVARDTALASLTLFRTREPTGAVGRGLLDEFPPTLIQSAGIRRVCALVEEVGRCLHDATREPDMTLAATVPEKLAMYKVLLDAGEGAASVRYHDPTDGALIEFRRTQDGVRYAVAGDARPVFREATLGVDDDGWYLEMPDIDTCVNLPTERGRIMPRLMRLFAAGGVHYTDTSDAGAWGAAAPPPAERGVTHSIPKATGLAVGVLMTLVRDVLRGGGGALAHAAMANAVEVLWRFATLLAALPERVPDVVEDLHRVIHTSVWVLRRYAEDAPAAASGMDKATHAALVFKARHALACFLYAAPQLFPGEAKRWDEVVTVDPTDAAAVTDDEGRKATAEGGGGDTDDDALPALAWAAALLQDMSAEGYAEAATLLGLVQYAAGDYEAAASTLEQTLKASDTERLEWRRWDCRVCLVYCHVMRGDYAAADAAVEAARPTARAEQVAAAEHFVAHRRYLAAGDIAAATAVLASAADTSLQTLMDQVNISIGTDGFAAAQKRLMTTIPPGSLLRRNLGASLCVMEAWAQLKKDSEGMPVMTAGASNAVMALAARAEETWAPSLAARVLSVLLGILKKDPERSSAALQQLRAELPGIDRSPLIHYWLSTVKEGVTCWDGLFTLLTEVGCASHDDARLWFALKAAVELGLEGFHKAFCPEVRPPDPTKLKGKEYREALGQQEGLKQQRAQKITRLRGILRACVDGLHALRPKSPYVAQKRKELDGIVG